VTSRAVSWEKVASRAIIVDNWARLALLEMADMLGKMFSLVENVPVGWGRGDKVLIVIELGGESGGGVVEEFFRPLGEVEKAGIKTKQTQCGGSKAIQGRDSRTCWLAYNWIL